MSKTGQGATQEFQIITPVVDLLDRPGGARVRQLLFGEPVVALGQKDGAYLVEALRDGYRGFVDPATLGPRHAPSHKVSVLATHLYAGPDLKSPDLASLSFGAQLCLTGQDGAFFVTQDGRFVPSAHVARAHLKFRDPVAVAELFLGTPYLWGGNSRLGIDCSGLVQTALLACGHACPGDSGDQERSLGRPVAEGQPPARGDLLFWKGHVALLADAGTLIHANAHHMAVTFEPLTEARRRISDQGGGDVTALRRL